MPALDRVEAKKVDEAPIKPSTKYSGRTLAFCMLAILEVAEIYLAIKTRSTPIVFGAVILGVTLLTLLIWQCAWRHKGEQASEEEAKPSDGPGRGLRPIGRHIDRGAQSSAVPDTCLAMKC